MTVGYIIYAFINSSCVSHYIYDVEQFSKHVIFLVGKINIKMSSLFAQAYNNRLL